MLDEESTVFYNKNPNLAFVNTYFVRRATSIKYQQDCMKTAQVDACCPYYLVFCYILTVKTVLHRRGYIAQLYFRKRRDWKYLIGANTFFLLCI